MKRKRQYNLFNKIRAALRDVYRYSPQRKEAIKAVSGKKQDGEHTFEAFLCPICKMPYPIQMADVDHEPPLGALEFLQGTAPECLGEWAYRLYCGPVQVICKLCHKQKTARQRSKKCQK